MASKQAMYRHEAKKALILQKRRVRANQERLGLRATDPDPIREKELDHMKLLLLENHLLLLNDTKEEDAKKEEKEYCTYAQAERGLSPHPEQK